MDHQNPYLKIIPPIVVAVIFVFSVMFIVSEKKDFSENENRQLAKAPALSVQTIKDKSFMDDFSTYICDHFPYRDQFINVKTQFEKMTGHTQVNGIYLAEDDFYIEPYVKPENTDSIIKGLNKFVGRLDKAAPVLMLVPNAATVYSDKLPKYAKSEDQIAVINEMYDAINVNTIDVTSTLLEHNEQDNLYYKLDHHWTTHGAYLAYEQFCKYKGFEPVLEEDFKIKTVTDEFYGTVFSKVNDYTAKGDKIDLYYYDKWKLNVTYSTKEGPDDSVYNLDYLKEKDKYSLFLNNLNALVTIENENADSDDELVVVKDSYANSIVPFLLKHYKKIYVFDTRYYRMPVSKFVNDNDKIKDVLILYNMNTLDTDLGVKAIF